MPIILLPAKSLEANRLNEILEANCKAIEALHQFNIDKITQTEKTLAELQEKGPRNDLAVQKAIIDACEQNLVHIDEQERRISEIQASPSSGLSVILIPKDTPIQERRQFLEDIKFKLKSVSDPEQKILLQSILFEFEKDRTFDGMNYVIIQKTELKYLKKLSSVLNTESVLGGMLGKIIGRLKNISFGEENVENIVLPKRTESEFLISYNIEEKIEIAQYPNQYYNAINLNLSGIVSRNPRIEIDFESKWGADVLREFDSYSSSLSAYNTDPSCKLRWLESQDKFLSLIKPRNMKEFLSDLHMAFPSQYNAYMAKLFIHQEKKNLREYDSHGQLNMRMRYVPRLSQK